LGERNTKTIEAARTVPGVFHVSGWKPRQADDPPETLRGVARELAETARDNVTIGWTPRENFRAHLRVLVRRILREHGYPPDKHEKTTQKVLEQAALWRRNARLWEKPE
jgi:hypothetical protein